MKVHLLFRDKDFDPEFPLPANEPSLTKDLELNTMFKAMANDGKFVFEVAKKAVLSSLDDVNAILYRQQILRDCLNNSAAIRELYALAVEAIDKEKKMFFSIFTRHPSGILYDSRKLSKMFVEMLKRLRAVADEHAGHFASEGFTTLFSMLREELDDEYFAALEGHLTVLKFSNGVLISAELGKGNKGINYVLRKTQQRKRGWIRRLIERKKLASYTFSIPDRDTSGARALSELQDRGLNLAANVLAQSANHILNFFIQLRTELAFYVGCLNLHEHLIRKEEPVSFPAPMDSGERVHSFKGLYDICLALSMRHRTMGNDASADGKNLVLITGANQGGKSTFLRSIGLAQLMMQCGMFVPANSFSANICGSLFTHYRRKEDAGMRSGKLDEELGRMSEIVDNLSANSLVLLNESFAATNEREGSEIARQIVGALVERRVKVFFVTHLYEYAHGVYDKHPADAVFLRAERESDGSRTFRIVEGKPLQTTFGEDLYRKIFGTKESIHPRPA